MDTAWHIAIDHGGEQPLYMQVVRGMEELIRAGSIPVGTLLDGEVELAERLGVSRPTMRRALAELAAEGLVVRQRGVGTRVVAAKERLPVVLSSFYDELATTGAAPTTQVLSLDLIEPTEALAEMFDSDQPLWEIQRLRSTRTGPLAVMHNWVPGTVTGLTARALSSTGLYAVLRASGLKWTVARQELGARSATDEVAALLEVEPGAACVSLRRMSFDPQGQLVELGEHLYRGDVYHFESTVVTR